MPHPERFRVVSWNVRYFSHAARGLGSTRSSRRGIASALAGLDPLPDIICLQEVETISLRSRVGRPPRRPDETQLQAFLETLGEEHAGRGKDHPYEAFYFPAHAYRLLATNLYTTGLAVLVHRERLAVVGHNADSPEPITHYHPIRIPGAKQSRICAHLAVTTPKGRRLHLFNTHLSLPSPFARGFWVGVGRMGHGANQVEEARKLAATVKRYSGGDAFVLCGDFNAPPASPVYRFLTGELGCTGAQESLGCLKPGCPDGHPTAGFLNLRMHLDHIFFGGPVRWLDCEGTHPFGIGPWKGLSDHAPLVGRFEVR